jgi:rfaE bifunctional protein nucleotidyltransferase chain/domain
MSSCEQRRRIVFTNGCFDVLHRGHIEVLRRCRELAGPLGTVIVGLNDDASVRRLKGDDRPIFDEDSRALVLLSLRYVDQVISFSDDTPAELIKELKPDVIVKGGDYTQDKVVGKEHALVVIVPLVGGVSTTEVVRRVRER